jgi:hypothetical protein
MVHSILAVSFMPTSISPGPRIIGGISRAVTVVFSLLNMLICDGFKSGMFESSGIPACAVYKKITTKINK